MILLELASAIGIDPRWAAGTGGGEYKSACPACGGKDRFSIQPHRQLKNCIGYYCCRQCGKSGDVIQFCRDFLGYSFHEATERVGATIQKESINFSPLSKLLKKQIKSKPFEILSPTAEWIRRAGAFVNWAHDQLLQNPGIIEYLVQRGITHEAIKLYKIGLCTKNLYRTRSTWGLPDIFENGKPKSLWLPRGIVIPTLNPNGNVIRIKIRRQDYRDDNELPKYVAVSGSASGLSIIGDMSCRSMIAVESELDAYAIHYTLGDLVTIVAVGSNIKNPDNITDHLAKHKEILLVCHDNDDAGIVMLQKWKRLYPHAKPYPTPFAKDIGDAFKEGLDVKKWLLEAIPEARWQKT